MVFSSLVFLCVFLPLCFVAERLMPTIHVKNAVLIVASLLFYAYGEPILLLLMIASTLFSYLAGRIVSGCSGASKKAWIVVTIVINLAFLAVFKYSGMVVSTLNNILHLNLPVLNIPLPLGISFYTFQALSYVIDVYRGEVIAQRRYSRVLLYISFFPQLIAGPIVKYHDIDQEIANRHASVYDVAEGLRRFILGLSKKVLIANTMAACADVLFELPASVIEAPGAWLASFAYLMQIYFDFSGYSDMAIGLGRMFGFHFKENFDHPYSSCTVKEFWRKWHISLSTWLRDYLYFPLGGNRKGRTRAILNRLIVFFACGLWHGANWTFVVWGMCHGCFLLLEEAVPLHKLPRTLGHVYTLLFVAIAFVIFRCDTLSQAFTIIHSMFCKWNITTTTLIPVVQQLTPLFLATAAIGLILCGSAPTRLKARLASQPGNLYKALDAGSYAASIVLLALCAIALSGGTYNPFIYFRF